MGDAPVQAQKPAVSQQSEFQQSAPIAEAGSKKEPPSPPPVPATFSQGKNAASGQREGPGLPTSPALESEKAETKTPSTISSQNIQPGSQTDRLPAIPNIPQAGAAEAQIPIQIPSEAGKSMQAQPGSAPPAKEQSRPLLTEARKREIIEQEKAWVQTHFLDRAIKNLSGAGFDTSVIEKNRELIQQRIEDGLNSAKAKDYGNAPFMGKWGERFLAKNGIALNTRQIEKAAGDAEFFSAQARDALCHEVAHHLQSPAVGQQSQLLHNLGTEAGAEAVSNTLLGNQTADLAYTSDLLLLSNALCAKGGGEARIKENFIRYNFLGFEDKEAAGRLEGDLQANTSQFSENGIPENRLDKLRLCQHLLTDNPNPEAIRLFSAFTSIPQEGINGFLLDDLNAQIQLEESRLSGSQITPAQPAPETP
jgi:hypothetical protein